MAVLKYWDGAAWRTLPSGTAQPLEAWHTIGAAGEPAFGAGFSASADVIKPAFRKDPFGKVAMRGFVVGPSAGGVVTTLPVGYRPPASYYRFAVPGAAGSANVYGMAYIDGVGVVTVAPTTGPPTSWDL